MSSSMLFALATAIEEVSTKLHKRPSSFAATKVARMQNEAAEIQTFDSCASGVTRIGVEGSERHDCGVVKLKRCVLCLEGSSRV